MEIYRNINNDIFISHFKTIIDNTKLKFESLNNDSVLVNNIISCLESMGHTLDSNIDTHSLNEITHPMIESIAAFTSIYNRMTNNEVFQEVSIMKYLKNVQMRYKAGLFGINAEEENDLIILKNVRMNDIKILKKIYSSRIGKYFMFKRKFLFSVRYEIPKSMAVDLYFIFLGAAQIKTGRYHKRFTNAAKAIRENTWLGNALKAKPNNDIDFKALNNKLNINLLSYQEKFIKEYFDNKDNRHLRGYFLAFDQGLGKTATALALNLLLKDDYTLILCPNNLKMVWAREIAKVIKGYDNDKKFEEEVYIQNVSTKFNRKKCKYIITNFKSFNKTVDLLNTTDKISLVVDESHNIKEITSVRFQRVYDFVERYSVQDCLLQSGTPIKGSAMELLHIFLLLEKYTGKMGESIYRKVLNTDNDNLLNVLNNKFKFISHRKIKIEVESDIKLPEKKFFKKYLKVPNQNKYVIKNVKDEMSAYIRDLYEQERPKVKEYRTKIDALIKKYKDATPYIRRNVDKYIKIINIMRKNAMDLTDADREFRNNFQKKLIKVMSNEDKKEFRLYVGRANGLYNSCVGKAVGNVYIKRYREMVSDIAINSTRVFNEIWNDSVSKKMVILTSYPEAAYKCQETLNDMGLNSVVITGDVDGKTRLKNIKAFSEDEDIHALIGTINILYVGFTFIEADSLVFLNQPWRDADRKQAADRIHRIGQTEVAKIYELFLKDTRPTLSSRSNDIINNSQKIFDTLVED